MLLFQFLLLNSCHGCFQLFNAIRSFSNSKSRNPFLLSVKNKINFWDLPFFLAVISLQVIATISVPKWVVKKREVENSNELRTALNSPHFFTKLKCKRTATVIQTIHFLACNISRKTGFDSSVLIEQSENCWKINNPGRKK